jgi:ElaB/YqjD/DUF883 family membrane-anchored ribosome-binding protein
VRLEPEPRGFRADVRKFNELPFVNDFRSAAMTQFFDAGKLADDLHALVSDAEALLRATAGQAGEKASEARERAEESLQALRERLEGLETVVKGRAKQVDGYVRDNPWQALAIAGGVALLVGILMGRSK